jgi:hypothetical protein
MMGLILAVCCIGLLAGCGDSIPEKRINGLKRPVSIVAVSPGGHVTVQGADGKLISIDGMTVTAKSLSTRKAGEIILFAK